MSIRFLLSMRKVFQFKSYPKSLCIFDAFVLHSCVTAKNRDLGTKKRLVKQDVIQTLVAEEGIEPPTHGL